MADENLSCHLWPQTPAVTWNGLLLRASRTAEETPFPAPLQQVALRALQLHRLSLDFETVKCSHSNIDT